jgi:hypothetical protein
VIAETRQNARGQQDQQFGHHLPVKAVADHLKCDNTPTKAQPRDSRGSKKFRTEFHREDTVH